MIPLQRLGACLVEGARRELDLTPKPGLVDRENSGSHPDLSFALMERSLDQLSEFFAAIAQSLAANEPFAAQRRLGLFAERRLQETLGTNTHKGFLFLGSMLMIARAQAGAPDEAALRCALAALAENFFHATPPRATHGERVREKYRVGGIVGEISRGLPSLFDQALPAYRAALDRHGDEETATFALFARLMQCVEDTTTLHRAGPPGLARIRRDGRRLERLIDEGGDFRAHLAALDEDYIRSNLTLGGVADLLGLTLGYALAG